MRKCSDLLRFCRGLQKKLHSKTRQVCCHHQQQPSLSLTFTVSITWPLPRNCQTNKSIYPCLDQTPSTTLYLLRLKSNSIVKRRPENSYILWLKNIGITSKLSFIFQNTFSMKKNWSISILHARTLTTKIRNGLKPTSFSAKKRLKRFIMIAYA